MQLDKLIPKIIWEKKHSRIATKTLKMRSYERCLVPANTKHTTEPPKWKQCGSDI